MTNLIRGKHLIGPFDESKLTLSATTPQNGQTQSNNSSAIVYPEKYLSAI